MLANKIKPSQVTKNVNFFQNLNLNSKGANILKITLGTGLLIAGGYYGYKIYQETQQDIVDQIKENKLSKDLYDDDTLIRVYKLLIKESYPVLSNGVEVCHTLKLHLRRENNGVEPEGLNATVFNQITDPSKNFSQFRRFFDKYLDSPLMKELREVR